MADYKYGWFRERLLKEKTMILYKCFTFNNNSMNALSKGGVFFNIAKNFNDPFDCGIDMKESVLTKFYGSMPEQRKQIEAAKERANTLGICCFSPIWNNILQWAHYADSFKGFCLGFEFKQLKGISDEVMVRFEGEDYYEADYRLAECLYYDRTNKPEVSDFISFAAGQTEYDYIITNMKTKEWSYEQECRLTCRKGMGVRPVPGKLKEVLFGLRMEEWQKKALYSVLENSSPTFFDTKISNDRLTIERTEYLNEPIKVGL